MKENLVCKKCGEPRKSGNKLCKKCNNARILAWKKKNCKIKECDNCWQEFFYYNKPPSHCPACHKKELSKKWRENNPNKSGKNNRKRVDFFI